MSFSFSFSNLESVFRRQMEVHGGGARVTVMQHGQVLFDQWAGKQNKKETRVDEKTLFPVASCTKAVSNICVARLVDQKRLEYDDCVAHHWPEFGQNGKASITVSELLTHRAGLPVFETMRDFPVSVLDGTAGTESREWAEWLDFLARQPPVCRGQIAYHAITVGFYVSALVYKLVGLRLSDYFNQEIRIPFNVDFFMGQYDGQPVPEDRLSRVFKGHDPDPPKRPTQLGAQAYLPMSKMHAFWPLRNTESPSHIGWATSHALAYLLQLVMHGRLFGLDTLDKALEFACEGHDLVLDDHRSWLVGGFMTLTSEKAGIPGGGPNVFGHTGLGGQIAFADRDLGLSIGYTSSAFLNDGSERLNEIILAVYQDLAEIPKHPSKL